MTLDLILRTIVVVPIAVTFVLMLWGIVMALGWWCLPLAVWLGALVWMLLRTPGRHDDRTA
jgi:hypothetical protein